MNEVLERLRQKIDKKAIKVSTCRLPHTYIKAVGTYELYKMLKEEEKRLQQEKKGTYLQGIADCEFKNMVEDLNKKRVEADADIIRINAKCEEYNLSVLVTDKEYEEEEERSWIPVDEQLPENDENVLLSFSNFSIPLVGRYYEDEEGGNFYVGDDEEPCIKGNVFVNAWMPLPKCYEES